MSQKGFVNGVLLFLAIFIGTGFLLRSHFGPSTKLRECPEAWRRPIASTVFEDQRAREDYYVHNGVRREMSDFDVNWVRKNCGLAVDLAQN